MTTRHQQGDSDRQYFLKHFFAVDQPSAIGTTGPTEVMPIAGGKLLTGPQHPLSKSIVSILASVDFAKCHCHSA
jgi:hypothetical protein